MALSPGLFARLSPHRLSQRCCIPGSPASPGAVEQNLLYVRDREGREGALSLGPMKQEGERERGREGVGKVAGFVLKPVLSDMRKSVSSSSSITTITTAAAAALRFRLGWAAHTVERGGEGRREEERRRSGAQHGLQGANYTDAPTPPPPPLQKHLKRRPDLCGAHVELSSMETAINNKH